MGSSRFLVVGADDLFSLHLIGMLPLRGALTPGLYRWIQHLNPNQLWLKLLIIAYTGQQETKT